MIASLYAVGYSPEKIYSLFKKYAKEIAKINAVNTLTVEYIM